jgi:hypothetical protein
VLQHKGRTLSFNLVTDADILVHCVRHTDLLYFFLNKKTP